MRQAGVVLGLGYYILAQQVVLHKQRPKTDKATARAVFQLSSISLSDGVESNVARFKYHTHCCFFIVGWGNRADMQRADFTRGGFRHFLHGQAPDMTCGWSEQIFQSHSEEWQVLSGSFSVGLQQVCFWLSVDR